MFMSVYVCEPKGITCVKDRLHCDHLVLHDQFLAYTHQFQRLEGLYAQQNGLSM
jgi:hypothetical protein